MSIKALIRHYIPEKYLILPKIIYRFSVSNKEILKNFIMSNYYTFKVRLRMLPIHKKRRKHDLDKELILSLTSYPPRFSTLHLTLKCLLTQSISPDKVVLWIANNDKQFLPAEVVSLKKYGLEINFCEDLKSYKKIIPALLENSDRYIITTDDDLYYPDDLVETLLAWYKERSDSVIASRTHVMTFDQNDVIKPYSRWKNESYDNSNPEFNFLTSGAGTLFPPGVFHDEVTNRDKFLLLCPQADDIWLNWMVWLKNNKIFNTEKKFPLISWKDSQEVALANHNLGNNENDVQIKAMIKQYGNPISLLKELIK
jgi:hypothetical protein